MHGNACRASLAEMIMRNQILRMLNVFLKAVGLKISPMGPPPGSDPDSIAARTVKEAEYYTYWQAPHPLFTPWTKHPSFTKYADGSAPNTVVSADRCYMLLALARYAARLEGDFAECGVFRGGTALILARVIAETTGKTLRLFDSFAGLSQEDAQHDNHYKKGNFASPRIHA